MILLKQQLFKVLNCSTSLILKLVSNSLYFLSLFLSSKSPPLLFSWFGCPPFVSTAGCASPTVPAPSQTTKSSLGISLTSSENVRRAQEWGICTRNRYKMGPNTSCKWADIGEFLGIERPDILITCIFFFSGYLFLIFKDLYHGHHHEITTGQRFLSFFYHHRTEDIEAYTLIQRTETWQNPRRIGSQKLTYHLPGGKTIRRIFQFDFWCSRFFFVGATFLFCKEGIWLQTFGGSILLFLGWKTVGVGGAMIFIEWRAGASKGSFFLHIFYGKWGFCEAFWV